jgi:hypothetical protein
LVSVLLLVGSFFFVLFLFLVALDFIAVLLGCLLPDKQRSLSMRVGCWMISQPLSLLLLSLARPLLDLSCRNFP